MYPFFYESEGAKLRNIRCDLQVSPNFVPWRQQLVDFLVAYRELFPTWQHAGQAVIGVNFHGLDPDVFPDEYVPEGRMARNMRFVVQRHLFGVGANTILEEWGPGTVASTDWEFTGVAPHMEAVDTGVWTTAVHVLGYNPNTCHGYMHGAAAGVDAELNGLPTSHRRGQAAFDELCARLPWLDTRFSPEGINKPALHPIVESERMYVVRSKDIHDILATAWRQDQAAPAAGAPPLRTQQGNLCTLSQWHDAMVHLRKSSHRRILAHGSPAHAPRATGVILGPPGLDSCNAEARKSPKLTQNYVHLAARGIHYRSSLPIELAIIFGG